jgi:hypothetical protein
VADQNLLNQETPEHLARLCVWVLLGIVVGLLPLIIAWFWEALRPRQRDYLRDFYWEGALLFLGPAIVGQLCAELTIRKTFFSDTFLSTIAILVVVFVVITSAVTYTAMMTERADAMEQGLSLDDAPTLTIIKEVSDAILVSSAVFAFSVTAVLYGKF